MCATVCRSVTVIETVESWVAAGEAALARGAWAEARVRFEAAVAAAEPPRGWEGLSWAGWWQGDQETTMAARERAYRAYRRAGDQRGAARMAMWLASDHLDFRGDDAVAWAWLRRGRALIGAYEQCAEHGFITLLEADIALANSDPETAERRAREALSIARGVRDVGVEVVALAVVGSALVAAGRIEDGVEWLEESGALAVGEDFPDAVSPGWALCHTVSTCADVGDFTRAAQWCRVMHTWSTTWQARHFFGVCRTAYGEVLANRGDWMSAERELLSALDDLRSTRPALARPAAVRLGSLRERQGDLAEARRLFEVALPLPAAIIALGRLDLAAGDATSAVDAADRVLRRFGDASVLDRFPALELLARARAAAGDTDRAHAAMEEVERQAARLGTPYMRGRGCLVRAHGRLAAGDYDGARQAAEDAADLFAACAAPYEAAEARMLLSTALEALGHHERSEAEARAGRDAFALLGVREDGRRCAAEELSPREADILRLVAQGLSGDRIAGRLFLSPHTVHRHVANIRTKFGVSSRAAAVAHATRHGLL